MDLGHVFGEMAFTNEVKRTATVTANEDLELIVFNQEHLIRAMKRYPRIATKLMLNLARILGSRLIQTGQDLIDIRTR